MQVLEKNEPPLNPYHGAVTSINWVTWPGDDLSENGTMRLKGDSSLESRTDLVKRRASIEDCSEVRGSYHRI